MSDTIVWMCGNDACNILRAGDHGPPQTDCTACGANDWKMLGTLR